MKTKKMINGVLITTMILSGLSAFAQSSLLVKSKFENAKTGEIVKSEKSVDLPAIEGSQKVFSHKVINKTILLLDIAKNIKMALVNYEKACKNVRPHPRPQPMPRPRGPVAQPTQRCRPTQPGTTATARCMPMPTPVPRPNDCLKKRKVIAAELLGGIEKISRDIYADVELLGTKKIVEVLDIARKLADNMTKATVRPPYYRPGYPSTPRGGMPTRSRSTAVPAGRAAAGGLSVSGGGAQDFGSFKMMVKNGQVPSKESLPIEGLLSEFDLAFANSPCDQLICVNAGTLIDPKHKKLFVQMDMNSNVTDQSFKRLPLNLSIVLDVSGSMGANDGTTKSRLQWAKESLIHIVNQMSEEDYLSIVLFDTSSEILLSTIAVAEKQKIIDMVNKLKTRGSTNMEKGLRDGYEMVSDNFKADYENRVILISDAGVNTGVRDESSLLKLVTDYASEKIGLSAIGLGLSFNQKLIHAITMSKGGNYSFVNSGVGMLKMVKAFKFMVTPVAYNFKASVEGTNLNAKLVKVYGVPMKESDPLRDLIDIRTLFFVGEGGGAIILEYDL